jgi:ATP-dependent helicase HrpB
VCTEGVFLRRLQDDPFLESTAVVVFDEFHERSVDSDLALALVRQVKNELRSDLKIVVMSATLDAAPIAKYLDNCPQVDCPGRMFPVDIEYLQFNSNESLDRLTCDGIKRMLQKSSGDILAFLPGVGEIRQTESLLQDSAEREDCVIMPLYGDMPLEEQRRVLIPAKQRKIVLSTNVAETSLTIDGVTAVVDSGMARVNRLDLRLGLNRLQVERISRASAEQRAGRAGRLSSGSCLRLWTEREQLSLRDFELPEIARVELSQTILQLYLWGETNPRSFPWYEMPPAQSVEQALELLDRLDALHAGQLTELGRRMAGLPLQPRLARLLVEGQNLGYGPRAALCAALLSERDPFRRQQTKGQAQQHSDSDVLDRLSALEDFAKTNQRHSYAGELLSGPAKQILRTAEQLGRLVADKKAPPRSGHSPDKTASAASADEAIMRALMVAFPDRVCKRREVRGRRALMVGGRGVRLADESAVAEADLFVAVELAESGQAESLVRQASYVDRSWLPTSHFSSTTDVVFDRERQKVMAFKRSRFCELLLSEQASAIPAGVDPGEVLANELSLRDDLESLIDEESLQYLLRVQCLQEWLPELGLPDFGSEPWKQILPDWCSGCASVDELKSRSLKPYIQMKLSPQQVMLIEQEAPERINLASGRQVKLSYERGKAPILAARIQELFGLKETPKIASGRIPVLMHLLAPNYRVQQITPDLASFWKNTYEDVRKELKGRYPKHPWPQDPLISLPPRKKD